MRVSELAKELGKSSKEVLDVLQKQGYGEKTHSSNVSDEQTQAIKKALAAPAKPEHAQGFRRGTKEEDCRCISPTECADHEESKTAGGSCTGSSTSSSCTGSASGRK